LGGEPRDKQPCRKFVASCFDKESGGFADRPGGKPDVFTTAVGAMAVVVLDMPLADFADGVVKFLSDNAKEFEDIRIAAAGLETVKKESPHNAKWVADIKKTASADGTFGTGAGLVRQTGSAAQVILRLGGKIDQQDKVLAVLKAGQRPDGGYGKPDVKGSDLETTYRLVRSLRMLKSQPENVEKCQAFVASCRNADGGYGLEPGQPSSGPATYFAAILLHWLGEK
jgi:prenyltransferase beta subunit